MKAKALIKKMDEATEAMKQDKLYESLDFWLGYLLSSLLDEKEIKKASQVLEHIPDAN